VHDDVNLVTHGITFPVKCDFIKLSQTTIGEGSKYDDGLKEFFGEGLEPDQARPWEGRQRQ